jgi:endo-1,4-beta-xylanase
MRLRVKLIFGVATAALAVCGIGCTTPGSGESVPSTQPTSTGGNEGSQPPGTGGIQETGGETGSGGGSATGGNGTGGAGEVGGSPGSGGQPDTGGAPGVGGEPGSGGAPAAGGSATADGGQAAGGATSRGGVSGTGGRGGAGGASGTGGRTGAGGMTANGGANGGATGTGGTSSAGGTAGAAGAPALPAKFVGNIDTRGSIRSDFATYWDQFSPENAGKWGSVQGSSQSSFNWTSLDAMYKYCGDNKIVYKQHNFLWGSQQPGWTSSLTTSTGPAAIQNWMTQYCQRYPNTLLIDVVNEPPPHTTPAYANAIGGGTNSTWDWIANAFKWARAACPNAILILNDYNNAELSGDVQHTTDIVNAIKKLGAPIDAVGCQTHGASNMSSSTLKTNIDKLASNTGLPVYITEYDINLADDNAQKTKYQDHFTMFMSNNNIKGITVWGYIVGATWVSNSGIMTSSGTMRPAMTWLMDFLGR